MSARALSSFILGCTACLPLSAQNLIVDGALELHTAPQACNFNLSSATFNGYYAAVTSFGSSPGIDIMDGSCSFGPPGVNGPTKLCLAWNNVSGGNKDAMALDLAAPLIPGGAYRLTFWADELVFGAGSVPFEIGVSLANNVFGTLIYSSTTPRGAWRQHTVVFSAPFAASHVTVQCPQGGDLWVAFDDFDLRGGQLQATNLPIGSGCHGLALAGSSRPVLGTSWDMDLTGVPSGATLAAMLLDLNNPNLSLASLGAPACTIYSGGLVFVLVPLPVSSPTSSIAIPLNYSFLGIQLYAQHAALVPGLNALGLATSNGLVGTVGDF